MRVQLLSHFLLHPETRDHIRALASQVDAQYSAVWKELNNLEEAGLLKSETLGGRKIFTLNSQYPILPELRNIILKTVGAGDLSTAESTIEVNPDWAYNISYNAMLQSSRALMLRKGYRPREPSQHATVVQFIKQTAGDEHRNLAAFFDQMRRKRNRLIYDAANLVGKKECQKALSLAHELVALLNNLIKQE